MSPALPQLPGKEVLRVLESVGFVHVSTKGSHAKLRHGDGRTVIVPLHRSLARGTLGSILRQAGLTHLSSASFWIDPSIGHVEEALDARVGV